MRWLVVTFNLKMPWVTPTVDSVHDDKLKARMRKKELESLWHQAGWKGEAVLFMERH